MAKKWTDEEIQFLKFAYPNKDFEIKEIATVLFRSKSRIMVKANELGLKRPTFQVCEGFKRCTKCGIIAPLSDFPKHKRTKDGYNSWCKICINSFRRDRKLIMERNASERNASELKVCSKCKKEKSISEFHKDSKRLDGVRSACKDCTIEDERRRYIRGGY